MTPAVNLNQPATGSHGLISHIQGDKDLKRKLLSLGLRVGQGVDIIHQRHNGVVVLSNGSRIALGAKVAAEVFMRMSEPALADGE